MDDLPSVEKFIKDGHDPVYAVYAFIQNFTSYFSEFVSQLPEMKKFYKIVIKCSCMLTCSFVSCIQMNIYPLIKPFIVLRK